MQEITAELETAGVDPATRAPLVSSQKEATTPEEFWSPSLEPAPGGEFIEEYGLLSPVPDHD